jgi:hypothetical protein
MNMEGLDPHIYFCFFSGMAITYWELATLLFLVEHANVFWEFDVCICEVFYCLYEF